eukprot:scaffold21118_cov112-Isochrysis_galbana.AAC.5
MRPRHISPGPNSVRRQHGGVRQKEKSKLNKFARSVHTAHRQTQARAEPQFASTPAPPVKNIGIQIYLFYELVHTFRRI